ncbi:MAG: YtcA family lipoprotein [Terracidiphilus sp.]
MKHFQRSLILSAVLVAAQLAGCRLAPTFNILGSFFPSWLICLFAGIIVAVIANRLFARFALDKEILWPVVVYPCIALLFACTIWLIFFS